MLYSVKTMNIAKAIITEDGGRHCCLREIGLAQNRSAEVCQNEACVNKIRPVKVRVSEIRFAEIGPTEIRATQICAAQIHSTQIHPTQICPSQHRLTQIWIIPIPSLSPRIPHCNPLPQDCQVFLVRHSGAPWSVRLWLYDTLRGNRVWHQR